MCVRVWGGGGALPPEGGIHLSLPYTSHPSPLGRLAILSIAFLPALAMCTTWNSCLTSRSLQRELGLALPGANLSLHSTGGGASGWRAAEDLAPTPMDADATPSSVMHVIARGSSDQWKTFASSPLMAAAMLIDGEIYDE